MNDLFVTYVILLSPYMNQRSKKSIFFFLVRCKQVDFSLIFFSFIAHHDKFYLFFRCFVILNSPIAKQKTIMTSLDFRLGKKTNERIFIRPKERKKATTRPIYRNGQQQHKSIKISIFKIFVFPFSSQIRENKKQEKNTRNEKTHPSFQQKKKRCHEFHFDHLLFAFVSFSYF